MIAKDTQIYRSVIHIEPNRTSKTEVQKYVLFKEQKKI